MAKEKGKQNPLRKLSRLQLLELLAQQERELQELRAAVQEKDAQLESRRIVLQESGSIAEAALRLNEVFAAAQRAADQYLESITGMALKAEEAPTGEETEV